MIIVLGSIRVKEACFDEALKMSQQHVNRSRNERGCISHGVHLDSENSLCLVFVEKWRDLATLDAHFKDPASIAFVKALENMVTQAPEMSIYDASQRR